jgi:tetratricopeptide (TPR) repeat protein
VYHGFETSPESSTSWVNHVVYHPQVFRYPLAYMEKLVFQPMYSFKGDVGRYYKSAVRYLEQKDVRLANKQEHDALEFALLSYDASEEHDWERARELALKALFQTQDIYLQSDLNNCIGYSWLMNRDYDKAIGYFERALELNIGNAFALDNMGFSYLLSGDLELGRSFIEKVISTSGNDEGYSYRNLALYYWKKGDLVTADSHFQKAIKHKGVKVDLLDELYQKFIAEFDVK